MLFKQCNMLTFGHFSLWNHKRWSRRSTHGAMNPMSKATTVHWQAAGQKEPGKGEELGNLKQLLQKRSTRTLDLPASGFVLNNFTKSLRNWYPLASFRFENKCPLCTLFCILRLQSWRNQRSWREIRMQRHWKILDAATFSFPAWLQANDWECGRW